MTVQKESYPRLDINNDWCKGCGICVSFCPKDILAINTETLKVEVHNSFLCVGCGNCEIYCPDFAVTITKSAP